MRELDECLELKREINKKHNKIVEIEAIITSPKNQIITGMPRSGSNDNAMDRYLIKKEKLQEQKENLQKQLDEKWDYVLSIFAKSDITVETAELLQLRFYKGLPWKICVLRLQKKHPKNGWNKNKAFRLYGKAEIIFRKI